MDGGWKFFGRPLLILLFCPASWSWHDLGNTDFHCWPLSATAQDPVPYAVCPGVDISWIRPPPEVIKAEEHFNVSYRLELGPDFWPWAISDQFKPNFFAQANRTGFKDAGAAKRWCEITECPTDTKKARVTNCCIHHVNVHSCPLSQVQLVKNGLCGPWIPAKGSIFTHSAVLVGPYDKNTEWVSVVEGLYQVGPGSLIAHFKVAGMHIALEKSLVVQPKTECGDGVCELEEGEACDTCPRDCGRCPLRAWQIGLIAAAAGIVLLTFAAIVIYFRYKQQKLLWDESWIIQWDDIKPGGQAGAFQSMVSVNSAGKISTTDKQNFIKTGIFNGGTVALKVLQKDEFSLTMAIRREVSKVRSLDHPHLLKFVGGTIEIPNVSIVSEYCPKGALTDVLENDDIPINWSFRLSFATDVSKAMEFLHANDLYHGRLKSSNCVVDDRWTVKVTDYGLETFRLENKEIDPSFEMKRRVYVAPEFLDGNIVATGPADVYAFSIILVEIASRTGPYGDEDPELVKPGWKPLIPELVYDNTENTCPCPEKYQDLIRRCWSMQSSERPTFESIRRGITKMNPSKISAVDMMMAMMEKYSTHLESLVAERTADLETEKQKTDKLLYSMLPKEVADELRYGRTIPATEYDQCSIYFSDIVGFTNLCSASTPIQVVALLNKLYITFDSIIDKYDVYKVETIGDAYMVVSGVPRRNGSAHAEQITLMSTDLLMASKSFIIPHVPDQQLRIRIGVHSGSVCAGVVGLKMPRYCLFGDTVNTASRMESNGEAYKIHVSDVTRAYLEMEEGFHLERRGTIPIKGKGEMKTWWLVKVRGKSVDPDSDSILPGAT